MSANLLVGLWGGDYQKIVGEELEARKEWRLSQSSRDESVEKAARERLRKSEPQFVLAQGRMQAHLFLGVFAALLTLLVNSVAITYFIGTSRWCKEVVDAYHFDPQLEEEGQRIKRQSFVWSLTGIFTIIAIVALGASADPVGWNHSRSASFVTPHYLAALVGICVIAFSYWQQWTKMSANFALVDRVMELVREKQSKKQEQPAEAHA